MLPLRPAAHFGGQGEFRERAMKIRARSLPTLAVGALRVSGQVDILMTEFGLEPPTALLGLIKAKDRVTIRFDLTADCEPLEEALGS